MNTLSPNFKDALSNVSTVSLRRSHLPGLDGIRALAVLSVVAYHFGWSWIRGGFLGVDLFFVLSGFLITSLLLEEQIESGRLALVAFWGRRARRLLPALFLMLAVVILVPLLVSQFGDPASVAGIDLSLLHGFGLSSFFYFANWFVIASGQNYFAGFSAPSPLLHTWSLAIEEQFYLLWPILVLWLARGGVLVRRRVGITVSILIAGGSSILMASLYAPTSNRINFVYNATFTRLFDLAAGAALAWMVVQRPSERLNVARANLVGAVALLGIVAAMVWSGDSVGTPRSFMFYGGFLVCAVLAHGSKRRQ